MSVIDVSFVGSNEVFGVSFRLLDQEREEDGSQGDHGHVVVGSNAQVLVSSDSNHLYGKQRSIKVSNGCVRERGRLEEKEKRRDSRRLPVRLFER